MTDLTGPGPAEPKSGPKQRTDSSPATRFSAERASQGNRTPERRQQRRWVPIAAGWIVFLVGLLDIAVGLTPVSSHLHHRLAGFAHAVPGTVTNLTKPADVIIGLLLLMLSHG